MVKEKPYLKTEKVVTEYHYNPDYGDDRICRCDHSYYRHFDSYDNMFPVGCKYCECEIFIEEVRQSAKKRIKKTTKERA